MLSDEVKEMTIYERIGGEAAVSSAVDRFYERVLADPTLGHFFSGISMGRLKAHQFAFFSQALGGPKQCSGQSMRDAHSRLAIEQCHFDSVAIHLVETLSELRVPEEVIGEISAAVSPLSAQIVNTPTRAAVS